MRLFELRSMTVRPRQSPRSPEMVPVRLAPEMMSFWRDGNEERFDGRGSWRGID